MADPPPQLRGFISHDSIPPSNYMQYTPSSGKILVPLYPYWCPPAPPMYKKPSWPNVTRDEIYSVRGFNATLGFHPPPLYGRSGHDWPGCPWPGDNATAISWWKPAPGLTTPRQHFINCPVWTAVFSTSIDQAMQSTQLRLRFARIRHKYLSTSL